MNDSASDFEVHVALLLYVAENGKLGRTIRPGSPAEGRIFVELLHDKLIEGSAVNHANGELDGIVSAVITMKGRDFIAKNQMADKPGKASDGEHTLWSYWKDADAGQRWGMIGVFGLIFGVGFACGKIEFFRQLWDLIAKLKQ